MNKKIKRERASQPGGSTAVDHDSDSDYLIDKDEEYPFACLICKKPYVKPVQTKCKHYFCESCAINRYMIDPRCAVCKENTNGIFNMAHKLAKKVEKRLLKEKEAQKQEENKEEDKDIAEDHKEEDKDIAEDLKEESPEEPQQSEDEEENE